MSEIYHILRFLIAIFFGCISLISELVALAFRELYKAVWYIGRSFGEIADRAGEIAFLFAEYPKEKNEENIKT